MDADYENTPCLVCGLQNDQAFTHKGQFGLPTNVVICRVCGFSYLNPRWTKQRYDAFYEKEYDLYYRPEIILQNDYNYRYKSIEIILNRIKERNLNIRYNRILDIGSGMGHALIYLKKNVNPAGSYNAIEPSENCKDYLAKNGINVLSPDVYSNWDEIHNQFDFIIMRHVLEHFHEPLEVLKKARRALNENGMLYIAVPDSFHPTKPLRSHFFRIVHISYFSKFSLSNLLKKAGLEILELSEGDMHEKSEIFVFCKKGLDQDFTPDSRQFEIQKSIYKKAGRYDLYYEIKAVLINILRRIRLIK
ncbi:MAG TPA: class I SAM-dependent methyltransferase [Chitinophagaceae bacterium]|nr:class I SAM-dependent methyltransferase [Chitinophagaceae bacterium]